MNFEQVYNAYFKRVYSYIRARITSETQADDIACEVWQKVFEKQSSFDESKGNIEQWLFTIARNQVNSHFRLYYIKNFFSMTDKEEVFSSKEKQPLDKLDEAEELKQLSAALEALNQKERDLISLKFFSSLNNREIAKITSLSESNVGTIINRAVNKIKTILEDL
jgi:RNA polymerase sigma-70 factor (ECF subfamily)